MRREAHVIILAAGLMGCSLTWNPLRRDGGSTDAAEDVSLDASDITSVNMPGIDSPDVSDLGSDHAPDTVADRDHADVVDATAMDVHEDVTLDLGTDVDDANDAPPEDVPPESGMDADVTTMLPDVDAGPPPDDGPTRVDLGLPPDDGPAADAGADIADAGDAACPTSVGDAGVTCDGGDCRHRVRKVAVGLGHACALMESGHVFCWGSNSEGQLGLGTTDTAAHPTPALVPCIANVVDVAAGPADTCVVLADGGVMCWGLNPCGGAGDQDAGPAMPRDGFCEGMGTYPRILTPRRIRLTGVGGSDLVVRNMTIASNHRCVRTVDRQVYCWGINHQGSTGTGTIGPATSRPGQVLRYRSGSDMEPLTDVEAVSAFSTHTCALITPRDGGPSEVRCWGPDDHGRLGTGDAGAPLPVAAYPVVGLRAPVAVSAGQVHSCALVDGGAAGGIPFCWGANAFGQLGNRRLSFCPTPSPIPVALDGGAALIAAGFELTCAAVGTATANALWCWGSNGNIRVFGTNPVDVCPLAGLPNCGEDAGPGVVGVGCNFEPVLIPNLRNVRQVAVGQYFLCATTVTGDAFCWGENTPGRLGDGTTMSRSAPVQVVFR